MQTPLNRIESEYIIKTFKRDTPPISILCGAELFVLKKEQYRIINETVYFNCIPFLLGKNITVIFTHKQRSFCFYTDTLQKERYLSFSLAQRIYKYDVGTADYNIPFAEIHINTSLKFSAFAAPELPLDHIIPQKEILSDPKRLNETVKKLIFRKNAAKKITASSLLRIIEFEKSAQSFFSAKTNRGMLFLFVDNIRLVTASVQTISRIIKKQQIESIRLHFPKRNITVSPASVEFYLPITQLPEVEIIGYSLTAAEEEDKRFLYENIYRGKYDL
ncbi:hypothetical protein [Treponema phagedenis]|uniref:Uncharacterized protein n=2 Tax=Treponema phagedenis TaxID=162 RepID=A0AAE6IXG9_TREPH|nr:hypothetical protein [Treponema phagedenis]QEJ99297.1 hypothetical protein FUT82_15740 [Treponema phagedenis]QEK00072.1 hypothetical protein FUT84_02000 [Treponema phagedenis]QEK04868.1 hypothetical protein FUT83_14390 [Treponema phagedenis]QEK07529.1 hypothetical protein FUT80_12900 [Treponema phagedenis]QEK10488.1 hypothetical protein FUT81_14305 [Treponema phagedenis]